MSKFKSAGTMVLGLVLAFGLLASPASASYTRIVGLGMNNWNVQDDFNIWLNPAWVPAYKDMVIAELGVNATVANAAGTIYNTPNAGTQWGGMIHETKEGIGTIGLFIRRPYGLADATGNYAGATAGSGFFGPTTRADLINNTNFANGAGLGGLGLLPGAVGGDIFLDGAGAFGPGDATGALLLGSMGGTNVTGAPAAVAAGSNHAITAPAMTNRVDLFWGKKELLSKDMDLGVNFSWAGGQNSPTYTRAGVSSQASDGSVTTARTSSDINIGAGVVYRMTGTFPVVEAAINVGMPSYSAERTESRLITAGGSTFQTATGSVKSNGASAMNIFVRAATNWGDSRNGYLTFRMASGNVNGNTVLKADIGGDGITTNDYDRSGTFKDSVSGWVLDHAKNFKANDNLNIFCSIGVSSMTVEQTATNTKNDTTTSGGFTGVGTMHNDSFKAEMFSIPVAIAAEHHTMDWLWTRFGVTKNVINSSKTTSSDNDPAIPTTAADPTFSNTRSFYADSALMMNTGVSVMVAKDFGIDAVLRQGILFGGPFFVSGVPNSMFGQLTAWYKF